MRAAIALVGLSVAYMVTLIVGLTTRRSSQDPVTGVAFAILEILIILMMPLLVALMAVVHAWARERAKAFSLIALVFTTLLAGTTVGVHFVILALGGSPAFSGPTWHRVLSFEWPSIPYALDILAWDVFFALAVLFVAPVFSGSTLARWIRITMIASGVLALAGLSGVIAGDMRLRNIGIAGYGVVFPVATLLIAFLFRSDGGDDPASGQGMDGSP